MTLCLERGHVKKNKLGQVKLKILNNYVFVGPFFDEQITFLMIQYSHQHGSSGQVTGQGVAQGHFIITLPPCACKMVSLTTGATLSPCPLDRAVLYMVPMGANRCKGCEV